MAAGPKRQAGDRAEEAVVRYLVQQGYAVLTRNFVCRQGELDIVAERDQTLCFVEVRMRSTAAWGDPSHTVSREKQRRVVKAALRYLLVNGLRGKMIRFDVASVVGSGPDASLEYIPNAFDAGM